MWNREVDLSTVKQENRKYLEYLWINYSFTHLRDQVENDDRQTN